MQAHARHAAPGWGTRRGRAPRQPGRLEAARQAGEERVQQVQLPQQAQRRRGRAARQQLRDLQHQAALCMTAMAQAQVGTLQRRSPQRAPRQAGHLVHALHQAGLGAHGLPRGHIDLQACCHIAVSHQGAANAMRLSRMPFQWP